MPKVGMEEIRREQVIAATTRCIVKKGVVNLSIKNIAAEAGVSTGIIYHYFKNKEEILIQVIKTTFWQSHSAVMETVEPLSSSKEKLFRHIENINAVPKANPDFYTVLLNYLGQAGSNDQVNAILTKFFTNLISYVEGYLNTGAKEKEFAIPIHHHLPKIVIALGMGLGIMWSIDNDLFDLDEMGETFKDLVQKFIE